MSSGLYINPALTPRINQYHSTFAHLPPAWYHHVFFRGFPTFTYHPAARWMTVLPTDGSPSSWWSPALWVLPSFHISCWHQPVYSDPQSPKSQILQHPKSQGMKAWPHKKQKAGGVTAWPLPGRRKHRNFYKGRKAIGKGTHPKPVDFLTTCRPQPHQYGVESALPAPLLYWIIYQPTEEKTPPYMPHLILHTYHPLHHCRSVAGHALAHTQFNNETGSGVNPS